jgi:hypothetical protein
LDGGSGPQPLAVDAALRSIGLLSSKQSSTKLFDTEAQTMELNRTIIEAAIVGFERQRQEIEETLAELRAQLNGKAPTKPGRKSKATDVAEVADAPEAKRTMSKAGRDAIRAALRKRWAAFHASKGPAPNAKAVTKEASKKAAVKTTAKATNAAPKRKLSAEAKAKLAENLAKARAAKAKKAA